jgi:hypothetical protein
MEERVTSLNIKYNTATNRIYPLNILGVIYMPRQFSLTE